MAKKQTDNQEQGVFSELKENMKWPLGLLGTFAGIGVLVYGFQMLDDPQATFKETKNFVNGVKDVFASEASIVMPDCVTEISKTVVSQGKSYTITCTPR